MIVRDQLTKHGEQFLPPEVAPWDKKYFEFERVHTGLSSGIITFGYRDHIDQGNGHVKLGPWLKLKEVP